MNIETYKFLKTIVRELADNIPLKIISTNNIASDKNTTACVIYPYSENHYICLNKFQIYNHLDILEKRGFNINLPLLSALLHEICHYKQYKKLMKKPGLFKRLRYILSNKKPNPYRERVADRYAILSCRDITKNFDKWKELAKI